MNSEYWSWNGAGRSGRATIWKKRLRKTTNNLSQEGHPLGRELNVGPLDLRARCFIWTVKVAVWTERHALRKHEVAAKKKIRYCLACVVTLLQLGAEDNSFAASSGMWRDAVYSGSCLTVLTKERSQARFQQYQGLWSLSSRHRRQQAGHMLLRPYATLRHLSEAKEMPQSLQWRECSRPKL
jgi:hypothetical protein